MSLHPRRFLIPVLAGLGFLGLTIAALGGQDFAFDRALILLFRHNGDPALPIGPQWFTEMMRDISGLGSTVGLGLMALAAVLALWFGGKTRLALMLLAGIGSATCVNFILKTLIGRSRPAIVEPIATTFTASFPSGHALMSAVTLISIAGFIGLISTNRRVNRFATLFAWGLMLLIGISRIYLGVHWPSDVLAGWCLGILWANLAVLAAERFLTGQSRG